MPRLSPADLPAGHAYTLEPGRPTPGPPNLLRPPIALHKGTGLLTCFPSTTPFGLALGADSPCADERCAGNLGLSASGPFTRFIATHVSIRTSDTSSKGHPSPSTAYGTLSYHQHTPFTSLPISCRPHSTVSVGFGFGFGLGRAARSLTKRLDFKSDALASAAPSGLNLQAG